MTPQPINPDREVRAEDSRFAVPPESPSPAVRVGILETLWGYDFFVSYAWEDGPTYPTRLVERLQTDGFRCFLDRNDYEVGNDLEKETVRRIKLSRKLILLARKSAVTVRPDKKNWVLKEVDTALQQGRELIVIDVNRTLESADDTNAVKQKTLGWLQIREQLAEMDGEPSVKTIQALVRSYTTLKRQTRRTTFFVIASLILLVLLSLAIWQTVRVMAAMTIERAERLRSDANYLRSQPDELELSVLLGAESLKLDPHPVTISDLQQSLALLPRRVQRLTWPSEPVSLKVSPDGALLVVQLRDGTGHIYDTADASIRDTVSDVSSFAISPSSESVAWVVGQQVVVWGKNGGKNALLDTQRLGEWSVRDIAILPGGERLVTFASGKLTLWNVAAREVLDRVDCGAEKKGASYLEAPLVRVSPQGNFVLTEWNQHVEVWEVTPEKKLRSCVSLAHAVDEFRFSPDDKSFAAVLNVSGDQGVFSWNGTAWREDEFSRFRRGIGTNVPLTPRLHYVGREWQTSLEVFGYQPPKSFERVKRLDYMATTAPGGIVQLFAERGFLDVEIARIKKLDDWSLAAQGPRLISIQGGTVDFWEPSGGTALVGAPVKDIRFCNDDKWLIVKTDVDLTVWDAWSSQRVTEVERTDLKNNKIWMSDSFISAAGESVAVITAELLADGDMQDNEIRICRSEIGTDVKASNRLVWCHDIHADEWQVKWCDANWVVARKERSSIWSAITGELVDEEIKEDVLGFSPDGTRRALVSTEGIVVEHFPTKDHAVRFPGNPSQIRFLNHGDVLIGLEGITLRAWNVENGRVMATLTLDGASTDRTRIVPSESGSRLALQTNENRILVWEPHTTSSYSFPHDATVTAVSLSHDGRYLSTATGSIVHVWDVNHQTEVARFAARATVKCLTFSSSDRFIAFGNEFGELTTRYWRAQDLLELAPQRVSRKLPSNQFPR